MWQLPFCGYQAGNADQLTVDCFSSQLCQIRDSMARRSRLRRPNAVLSNWRREKSPGSSCCGDTGTVRVDDFVKLVEVAQ